MTTRTSSPRSRRPGRLAAALAYDGAVPTVAMQCFQYFVVSVSFLAAVSPAAAFQLIVGWQPTHLAIWFGAASLVTLPPAVYALIAAARSHLIRGEVSGAGARFWRTFARAFRSLGWLCASFPLAAAVLAYDAALLGRSDAGMLIVAATAGVIGLYTVGLCAAAEATGVTRALHLPVLAARLIARRPHVALSWGLLALLGALATTIPLVGAAAWLFAPAAVGAGIAVCNTALRFAPDTLEQYP